MEDSAEQQLRALYYDPSTGFASASALYKRAKQQGLKVSLAKVKDWMKVQETSQVFHRRTVKAHYPLISYSPFTRIQIDLADVSQLSRWNGGVKFLFCAIDVFTRFAFVLPLKSKGDAEVLAAWKAIVEQIVTRTGFPPSQLDSDQESSFMSRNFKAYCEELLISQKLLPIDDMKGTAVVERFIRTVRELLNRYMVAYNTKSYRAVLPALVENYNTRINQGIRTTPEDATTDPKYEDRYWGLISGRVARASSAAEQGEYQGLKVGDKVRVLLRKKAFEKGTAQKWSSTTHTVESFEDGLYQVTGRVAGYKPYELQVVREVQHLPVAAPAAVAALAEEAKEEEVDRRVTRRIGLEGIPRNDRPGLTDEERSLRAIRRRPVDRGPYLSYQ